MSAEQPNAASARRVALSSYLGTTLEYYDFLLYGTAAALVFRHVFFSDLSPVVGTIVSLGTLAAGYVARLVGALAFGYFGDRLGRKRIMLATLVIMGLTSGTIGLLPTYEQIGIAAPLLLVLLRVIQGLAVGGEYGGAVLMSAEHAGTGRRGLASSAPAMGGPSGSVLATIAMLIVAALPEDVMLSWGWRVPFLISFGFLAVALYFRLRIDESPVFLAEKSASTPTNPIGTMLRSHSGIVVKSVMLQVCVYAGQGVFGIFIITYGPDIGYDRSAILTAVLIGTVGGIIVTPIYAALSDKYGRRPFILAAIVATGVVAYPAFYLINLGSTVIMTMVIVAYVTIVMPAALAVAPVYLTELFPTRIRYTAFSTSYQIAQILGSGTAPVIAASLLALAGGGTNTGLISLYLIGLAVVGVVGALLLPERHMSRLADQPTDESSKSHDLPAHS